MIYVSAVSILLTTFSAPQAVGERDRTSSIVLDMKMQSKMVSDTKIPVFMLRSKRIETYYQIVSGLQSYATHVPSKVLPKSTSNTTPRIP
jgi:hypothetical protein